MVTQLFKKQKKNSESDPHSYEATKAVTKKAQKNISEAPRRFKPMTPKRSVNPSCQKIILLAVFLLNLIR